ncbi:MAG TPA: hypothetical protein VEO01_32585, partial [Pseudonocardiaceae bacterium]|nr:hypothetical protein [Pseudonocardiaceae bacterium]
MPPHEPEPPGESLPTTENGGYRVDARYAHGVLIGDHGTVVVQPSPRHRPRHLGQQEPRRVFISHTAELRA